MKTLFEIKNLNMHYPITDGITNTVKGYIYALNDVNLQIFENEILTIPHKELQNRAFVLVPMLEIAENFIHPTLNKTISELYDDLENPEEIFLYGTIKGDR